MVLYDEIRFYFKLIHFGPQTLKTNGYSYSNPSILNFFDMLNAFF